MANEWIVTGGTGGTGSVCGIAVVNAALVLSIRTHCLCQSIIVITSNSISINGASWYCYLCLHKFLQQCFVLVQKRAR